MLYSFFLIMKNVGCSSAFRPRYPNIYYRTTKNLREFFTYMMVLITISLSGMLGMPPGCSVDRLAAVTA